MSTIEIFFSKKSAFYIFKDLYALHSQIIGLKEERSTAKSMKKLHTTQETAKNAVIFHTHYNLFFTIATFFQQVYI